MTTVARDAGRVVDMLAPRPSPAADKGFIGAPSYWLATMDPSVFPAPTRVPPHADAVVIGGGLMGVAVAFWLARRGLAVLVAEARRLSWGASGRNAGIVLPGLHPLEAGEQVPSILAEEHMDAGYARPGHLSLASSRDVLEQFRAEAARRPTTAPTLHVLDRSACEDLLGAPIAPTFAGGRWAPDGRVINPVRLVGGLAAGAQRRGAGIATDTTVLAVEPRSRGPRLAVRTSRGTVLTDHVIYACNVAVTGFRPELQRVLSPLRCQVMATDPLPPVFRMGMAVDFGAVYWRQADDGTIVLGGCRDHALGNDEHSAVPRTNPRVHEALDAVLPRSFPQFPPFTVRWRWAGITDRTADGRPLVGALPHADGQWIIAGFGGHGLPAGLGAGRALAEAVSTGQPSPAISSLAPDRLIDGSWSGDQ